MVALPGKILAISITILLVSKYFRKYHISHEKKFRDPFITQKNAHNTRKQVSCRYFLSLGKELKVEINSCMKK